MKPEIHLPRVNSGKISLGKTMFPRAKVRSVTTAIIDLLYEKTDLKKNIMYEKWKDFKSYKNGHFLEFIM